MTAIIVLHEDGEHPLFPFWSDTKNWLKYSFQSVFNAAPALHFRDDKASIAKTRLVPITVEGLIIHADLALIRSLDTHDALDQSWFTGAVFSDQCTNLALIQREVHIIQCGSAGIELADMFYY